MADVAAVKFLLEQVTGVIKGYADLISGADQEFKKLKEEVEELKNILMDTAQKSSEDNVVRSTKNKIREVVYEVEDAIDSWLTESKASKQNKVKRGFKKFDFAKRVKSLREEKVKDMLEKANKMKRDLASTSTNTVEEDQQRRGDPPIRKDKVVGLKDEEDKIKGYLKADQPKLDIIPIIGMPGLGKTTLTWKIFHDEKICYDFPIRIWVHFSQRFNTKDVLIQIMKYFTSNVEELYRKTERELCDSVHTCLKRDKFLLVVDDVWEKGHWDAIKLALPYHNGNGKVVITSREMEVGIHVQEITEAHKQRPLNEAESWELLQLEIFGETGCCSDELEGIGIAIAEKCQGIPLIIVVIGGVLKQSLSLKSDGLIKEKWMEVATNENLGLKDQKKVISDVVALSYDRMPERLRDCFLYLGVFPAGYKIQTWTLTRLWIAEGFIQPDHEELSMEKIAEKNLNDLIGRNLLMVSKMNPMREVKVCRVHDMIRMFCTTKANEQNLFKEVRMSEGNNADMDEIHRLCLHSDLDKFFAAKLKGPRVRSFLCFRNDATSLLPENASAMYENFLALRILESKSIKFKKFNPKITKLNHLRYIVLCVPELDTLPSPVSELWNLQTIVLETNSESLTMKASLRKMNRLRHLKTKAAILLEVGDQPGDNLQTLNRLSPESVPKISQKANNIKTLAVKGILAPLFEDMRLGNMSHLEKLKLYQTAASENRLQLFPDSKCFPPKLRRLTLSKTFLEWRHMPTLAMIPDLEVLKLKENAFTGISWEAQNQAFRKLHVLHILSSDLVIWKVSDSTFPCLRHLEVKSCDSLSEIPDGILQRLENLDIGRVRKSIAESAKKFIKGKKLKLGADLI